MPELKVKEKQLSRPEATLLANWLKNTGRNLPQGWLDVWKKTPSTLSLEFDIEVKKINEVIRRS